MSTPAIFIEIGRNSLKLLKNGTGLEAPLERADNGRLTAGCKEKLISTLKSFLNKKSWQPRQRAYCAIAANGVSVRRMSLPSAPSDQNFQQILKLQVEAEFPLPPDELAWGWRPAGDDRANGTPAATQVVVAAVRREVIEDYAAVLAACELAPEFTLGALARQAHCPQPQESCAMLEVGRKNSELALFEKGILATVQILPLGQDDFFGSQAGLDSLAQGIARTQTAGMVFITGDATLHQDFPVQLQSRLPNGLRCARLDTMGGEGRSATTLGLKKSVDASPGRPLLILRTKPKEPVGWQKWSQPDARKLLLATAALVVGLLLAPFAESIVLKPFLARKLAALKSDRSRLPMLDRELDFLEYLKQNQPPALDVLYVFAKSAPPGAKIESFSMDRHGDIAVRCSMQNGDQVTEFRSKLIASGGFTQVTVEEQNPTPDRQKVNVRLSARSRPAAELAALPIGPTAEEIEKAKSAPPDAGGGPLGMGFAEGMVPGGLPAGVVMPPGVMPMGSPRARGRGAPPGVSPGMPMDMPGN